ncbi:MAG: histidine phosphatase family protein [Pseudohongiellaceae bacterium]
MKTLYLLRHAKSSWASPDVKDFDRPLNERGFDDAPEMALRLKERGVTIDLVVSSPALRAYTTATIFCDVLGIDVAKIVQDRQIYLAGSAKLLQLITLFDESADSAMLVAHNPALTDLANDLAHAGIDNIPTTGLVTLQLPVEHWFDAQAGQAKLLSFDFPKNPD